MGKNFSPIKERLIQFIENKGISRSEFFQRAGLSPSNFKGRMSESELGGDKLVNILTVFPEISPKWLLTGEGNMIDNPDHITKGNDDPDLVTTLKRLIDSQDEVISMLKKRVASLENEIETHSMKLSTKDPVSVK